MKELLHVIEPPRRCSYLPHEVAALEYRVIRDLTPSEYADLLARGYRRFGWQLFRPACPACTACRSMRIVVPPFAPNASERRVLRKNADLRAELHPLFAAREIVELYNRYHRFMHQHRGWPFEPATLRSYHDSFLSGPAHLGRQWLYFDRDQLVGVALMDEVPGAISLVYAFFHPDHRSRSLGTFSILNQLRYAQSRQLDHAYLGYWIEECQSMSYKGRFHPREILREYPPDYAEPVWE